MADIKVQNHNEGKSFLVKGNDTFTHRRALRTSLGGSWNRSLNAWVFPNERREQFNTWFEEMSKNPNKITEPKTPKGNTHVQSTQNENRATPNNTTEMLLKILRQQEEILSLLRGKPEARQGQVIQEMDLSVSESTPSPVRSELSTEIHDFDHLFRKTR